MSRFGLRSNAENLKISDDEKLSRRNKLCKTAIVPIKRVQTTTTGSYMSDAATSPAYKENLIKTTLMKTPTVNDYITKTAEKEEIARIEIQNNEDIRKCNILATTTTNIIGATNKYDNVDGDNDNITETRSINTIAVETTTAVVSTTNINSGRTLLCRLPLIHLTDVLEKLKLSKIQNEESNNLDDFIGDEDDEDDEQQPLDEQKQKNNIDNGMMTYSSRQKTEINKVSSTAIETTTVKILCLYCDKKFSSHKMQVKHVDKFHCQQQDRRCSGRKVPVTQVASQKRKTNLQHATVSQSFPGCSFCFKTLKSGITANSYLNPFTGASDLNALFVHLIDCHADKYFGCKTCAIRFQNISNLSKHMQLVHKHLPFTYDETSSSKSKDNDTETPTLSEKTIIATYNERNNKVVLKRNPQQQRTKSCGTVNCTVVASSAYNISSAGSNGTIGVSAAAIGNGGGNYCMSPLCVVGPSQYNTAVNTDTTVIGAEEPILSRLGLTQNRLPNNRKGIRLRRENLLPEALLKSEQTLCANFTSSSSVSSLSPGGNTNNLMPPSITASSLSSTICSPKIRGSKAVKHINTFVNDAIPPDIIFRVPTRNDILSCVFDDNFYKEVVSNVRNNLLLYLDGKISSNDIPSVDVRLTSSSINTNNNSMESYIPEIIKSNSQPPQIRSTLVKSPIIVTTLDNSEIHAATTLTAITAFPTLLTTEQYGGDAVLSKLRRPHTKNSWKWKWDSVKKFKIVNEGGKIVKKMKHPMFGLRDLSKLDMWTQLTMRQKHEYQQQLQQQQIPGDINRKVKQKLNDQLNWILDMRLLPPIILEQNEQAIIKLENDELEIPASRMQPLEDDLRNTNCPRNKIHQTLANENFLAMLNLLPNRESQSVRQQLVLSGEWARPRCYLCMCCGVKFEKLKSLEEHKMFRHSHILSNHYEVVGRELLAGNLLRHLFIPKKALSRYGNDLNLMTQQCYGNMSTGVSRRLFGQNKNQLDAHNNDESSDCSLQSVLNSCIITNCSSSKTPSCVEDCDTDVKLNTDQSNGTITNNVLDITSSPQVIVSPAHSIQSCSSSIASSSGGSGISCSSSSNSKQLKFRKTGIAGSTRPIITCSKCKRKCNGLKDLYRHMLDCSGDYIWTMAKKRKYRYYCGSKKRRPCNKHHVLELRKNKPKAAAKTALSNTTTTIAANISLNVDVDDGIDRGDTPMYAIKIKTPSKTRPSDAESIKKMLENLPPKRVCKKIYPLLTKTVIKGGGNNQLKPKLILKRKIYRRLRNRRIRKLTNMARFLTKSKKAENKRQQQQKKRKQLKRQQQRCHKQNITTDADPVVQPSINCSIRQHLPCTTKLSLSNKVYNPKKVICDETLTMTQTLSDCNKEKEKFGSTYYDQGGCVDVATSLPSSFNKFVKSDYNTIVKRYDNNNRDSYENDHVLNESLESSLEKNNTSTGQLSLKETTLLKKVTNLKVEEEEEVLFSRKEKQSKDIEETFKTNVADNITDSNLSVRIISTNNASAPITSKMHTDCTLSSKLIVSPLSSLMPSPVLNNCNNTTDQVKNFFNNNNPNKKNINVNTINKNNNKRSKCIHDCIAKLTGKLAQKIKSETKESNEKTNNQNINNGDNDHNKSKNDFTSTITRSPFNTNFKETTTWTTSMTNITPIQTVIMSTPEVTITKVVLQQNSSNAECTTKTSEASVPSDLWPKKTPKRKAISRRIIKAPKLFDTMATNTVGINCSTTQAATTTAITPILSYNVPTTTLTDLSLTTVAKVPVVSMPLTICTTVKPIQTTITPLTTCSNVLKNNVNNNNNKNIISSNLKPVVTTVISSIRQVKTNQVESTINIKRSTTNSTTKTAPSILTPSLTNVLPSNVIPVYTLNMVPETSVYAPITAVNEAVAATTHINNIPLPSSLKMSMVLPMKENVTCQEQSPHNAINNNINDKTGLRIAGNGIVSSMLSPENDGRNVMTERRHFVKSINVLPHKSTTTNFCVEPLNLSSYRNSKTININDSQDLSSTYNGHIVGDNGLGPIRRQTICGFEDSSFLLYDEIQPLDLSKNSRQSVVLSNDTFPASTEKLSATSPVMSLPTVQPLTTTVTTPIAQPNFSTALLQKLSQSLAQQQYQSIPPHQLVVPISDSGGDFTISALTPEVLSKQFYSNLHLLRIPQIRNPVTSISTTCATVTTNSSTELFGINTVAAITTPTTTTTITTNSSIARINNINNAIVVTQPVSKMTTPSTSLIVTTPKPSNKKRYPKNYSINLNSNNNNGMKITSSASINEIVNAVATSTTTLTSTTSSKGKDINNKVKDNLKNKVSLKMDEEVINHIDDAINSVINAVKASLKDSEEAEKLKQQQEQQVNSSKQQSLLDVTASQNSQQSAVHQQQTLVLLHNTAKQILPTAPQSTTTSATIIPTKKIDPDVQCVAYIKRSTRSKTLDCRPTALITKSLNINNIQYTDKTKPVIEHNNLEKSKVIEILDGSSTPIESISAPREKQFTKEVEVELKKSLRPLNKTILETVTKTNTQQMTGIISGTITKQSGQSEDVEERRFTTISTANFKQTPSIITVGMESKITNKPDEENIETQKKVDTESATSIATATSTAPVTVNNVSLELEQMNKVDNSSIGFRDPVQSGQVSTTPASSVAITTPIKDIDGANITFDATVKTKKQRKRRKNELAAIVADQLLESFKIDKTRRDNLKKLENLAYEKSEDLLLTGMLLMSSTKRSATTAGGASVSTVDSVENNSTNGLNKRHKRNVNYNGETTISTRMGKPGTSVKEIKATTALTTIKEHKIDKKNRLSTSTVNATEQVVEQNTNYISNPTSSKDQSIRSKKRLCRGGRRGKLLDNENISRLKSSLESFSIDIERQLVEFESKNVNFFKNTNVTLTEVKNRNNTNITKNNATTLSKSSVILRPSILSMTLDTVNQSNNSSQQGSKVPNGDINNKSTVSSRDPRLNKNIHKEKGDLPRKSPKSKTCETPEVLDEIGDMDEDNYLTEIAKNVNEKIMSNEIEEFVFKNDGFEMVHDLQDDSNSKLSRPPTAMSVHSAPNFNDDRSNFDSICDENTNINAEALDMDLDDEMSVYTSCSQELGRGRRGRRRRRRRSILLSRKSKKRSSSRDRTNDKIECVLCKKTFYSANSLAKHNMTLAHVSKVSEQEYLLSKKIGNATAAALISHETSRHGSLGPYARRTTRRATISEPFCHITTNSTFSYVDNEKRSTDVLNNTLPVAVSQYRSTEVKSLIPSKTIINEAAEPLSSKIEDKQKILAETLNKGQPTSLCDLNNSPCNLMGFSSNSRLNLNPDERLFFECCNILKGAETPRLDSHIAGNSHQSSYAYISYNGVNSTLINNSIAASTVMEQQQQPNPTGKLCLTFTTPSSAHLQPSIGNQINELPSTLMDPPNVTASPCGTSFTKGTLQDRNMRSPIYSCTSQLSVVTNTTTSRFKTKAAMKGYENNIGLALQQHESKSRTICKLTELAEIALGNEDKQVIGSQETFSPLHENNYNTNGRDKNNKIPVNNNEPPQSQQPLCTTTLATPLGNCNDTVIIEQQQSILPEYGSLSTVQDHSKNALPSTTCLQLRNDRNKNETRSSTSSKTIMHSSIIKAAVEEHQKTTLSSMNNSKIIIPDRPFKNIGLEEKESITFQKPKTPAVNLLTDDNSVSTASFSDRDDYDFGSLSCDDEVSIHDGKRLKSSSSDSSFESSRATAKTFENKSLIMGRIFKNASTKALNTKNMVIGVKQKSVGIQKDQTSIPKADLNQLFDELRGGGNSKPIVHHGNHEHSIESANPINRINTGGLVASGKLTMGNNKRKDAVNTGNKLQNKTLHASSPPAVVSSTTSTPAARKNRNIRKKPNANITSRKSRKDITKLQSELGMNSDEIKKLIDEGQRKSKRRCATNRPKKLVEIWSSDEYEEFLSTKDIIALIEEKEQEEKRRKRKSSINLPSSTSMDKENGKELPSDVTSSTKDIRRRNPRKSVYNCGVNAEHQTRKLFEKAENKEFERNCRLTKYSKTKTIATSTIKKIATMGKEEEPVSTTAIVQAVVSGSAHSSKALKKSNRTPKVYNKRNNKGNGSKAVRSARGSGNNAKTGTKSLAKCKGTQRGKAARFVEISEENNDDVQVTDIDGNCNNDNNEDEDNEDYRILELKKCKKPNLTRKKVEYGKRSKIQVTSSEGNNNIVVKDSHKRGNGNSKNTISYCVTSMDRNTKLHIQQARERDQVSTPKNKRKSQINQSSPRRKRMASEKLYYWSSSSDDDFGLINQQNNQNEKSHMKSIIIASTTTGATTAAISDNYDCGNNSIDGIDGKGVNGSTGCGSISNNGEQYQKHGWIVGDSHKKLVTLLAIAKGNNKKVDLSSGVKSKTTKKRN